MALTAPRAASAARRPDLPAGVERLGDVLHDVARASGAVVEIRHLDDAIKLADEWRLCARARLRAIWKLWDDLFWMRHERDVQFFRAELYAAQLRNAGITPADEIKSSLTNPSGVSRAEEKKVEAIAA